jgi:hypothetical protein
VQVILSARTAHLGNTCRSQSAHAKRFGNSPAKSATTIGIPANGWRCLLHRCTTIISNELSSAFFFSSINDEIGQRSCEVCRKSIAMTLSACRGEARKVTPLLRCSRQSRAFRTSYQPDAEDRAADSMATPSSSSVVQFAQMMFTDQVYRTRLRSFFTALFCEAHF